MVVFMRCVPLLIMIRNVALAMVTEVFTPVEGDGRNMGELEHILGKVLEQAIARDMMFSSAASVPAVQTMAWPCILHLKLSLESHVTLWSVITPANWIRISWIPIG